MIYYLQSQKISLVWYLYDFYNSAGSNHIPRYPLSPSFSRVFSTLTPTKRVCTMDCTHCRSFMARNLRSESPNNGKALFGSECLSAPCSRKSSVVFHGKFVYFKFVTFCKPFLVSKEQLFPLLYLLLCELQQILLGLSGRDI